MKQKSRLLAVLITSMLLVEQGCDEGQNPKYDYQTIWKCHYKNNWTYETTKNKIVGLWEWEYIKCCGETTMPYQNNKESKGLTIEFKANGTGILTNKDIIRGFTWDIEIEDNDLYGFITTPSISQLHGRLLFCNTRMMCNNSYIDGADNFLRKIETGGN